MLSYIAPALLYAIIGGGIVAAFCRVGGDAQARDDAAHKRANADRRSLSGGAAKPLHALSDNGKVQHDHGA